MWLVDCLRRCHAYLSQQGPHHSKHSGWIHPTVVCVLHYAVVLPSMLLAHDLLVTKYYFIGIATVNDVSNQHTSHETQISSLNDLCFKGPHGLLPENPIIVPAFFFLYAMWLLVWRIYVSLPTTVPQGPTQTSQPACSLANTILYEYCWLCTLSLHLGWIALVTNRPILASACCVTIGIDQLLWYVDLCHYLVTKIFQTKPSFLVGVCKYLFWEGTTFLSRITCTHHLWTLPILLVESRGVHRLALPLSAILMTMNVLLSRWWTPSHVVLITGIEDKVRDKQASSIRKDTIKYLNVNLSHSFWKDVPISCLQIHSDNPPVQVYLFRLLWRWIAFNTCVYFVLSLLCQRLFFSDAYEPPICYRP